MTLATAAAAGLGAPRWLWIGMLVLAVALFVGSLKSCQTMKEAYAVRPTIPPSAEIQAKIDGLLGTGMEVVRDLVEL